MKMQIDTTAKTIKIEGDVKLSVLFDHLQKFFPGGEWEDYDLQTNTVINNWASPIIINKPYPIVDGPYRGRQYGEVTFTGGTTTITGNPACVTGNTFVLDETFDGAITNCGTDINHPNNQNFTLTTASSGGPIIIDMSNAPTPEVSTSGYCQTVGIYNIELN